ncbi:MAG: hypothetical protein ACR2H1_04545 [Limisphaerales bacterium]
MQNKFFLILFLLMLSFSAERIFAESESRPFLAIWREDEGLRRNAKAPYLRIAVWNDGRILFAKNTKEWGHDLLEGRIEKARITELKKAIKATGIFELQGNCYLVPDGPEDCLMVDLGDKQQMLYWDEIESPGWGINSNPKPQHKTFKQCWKNVNRLALESIPKKSHSYEKRFKRPPSWILKRPIQSE